MMDIDALSTCVASCFGREHVSEELAQELSTHIPVATFARKSLAGIVMKEGKAVTLNMKQCSTNHQESKSSAGAPVSVACFPIGVCSSTVHPDPSSCSTSNLGQPSFIGALHLGLLCPFPSELYEVVYKLCHGLGKYMLLISLTKVQDMAKLMELPLGDCSCCAHDEDDVEDASNGRCRNDSFGPDPSGDTAPYQSVAAAATEGVVAQELVHSQEPFTSITAPADDTATHIPAEDGTAAPAATADFVKSQNALLSKQPEALDEAAMGVRYRGASPSKAGTSAHFSMLSLELEGDGKKGRVYYDTAPTSKKVPLPSTSGEHLHGEEQEQDDPKVAVRRAGQLALASKLRQGVLLTFADSSLESRFRREQAKDLFKLDFLFHLVYLVALICTALLDPSGVLGISTNIWFAWILVLPALTILFETRTYVRWRSRVIIPFTLLHMAHYRLVAAPALLSVLPGTSLQKLPWLLRCTGAEALLVFPLGNKMPFSMFFPVHLVSMLFMLSLMPGPCNAIAPQLGAAAVCLPLELGLRSLAVLLGAGFVLPTCVIYFAEARARGQFSQAVQGLQA